MNSLVAADVDGDGLADIIAVGDGDEVQMAMYRGDAVGLDKHTTLPSVRYTQPTFLDAHGTLNTDYLGYSADTLSLFRNTNGSFAATPLNFDGRPCQLAQTHSNAFIDLNGDCLADVFLLCSDSSSGHSPPTSFQIWLNNASTNTFTLHSQTSLPPNSGLVTFADFNRDGTIDMVFPSCGRVDASGVGHDCHINVWFNTQIPLCVDRRSVDALLHPSLLNSDHCRNPADLCVADDTFVLDGKDALAVSVDTLTSHRATLKMADRTLHDQPLLLRLGDYNLDSFPDILAVMRYEDGSDRGVIVENVPLHGNRSLEIREDAKYSALHNITDVRAVSWLDIDDDGTLDIMVQRQSPENRVTFIQNNIPNDAFFIKTLLLNGACDIYCVNATNEKDRYKAFGANLIGGSYKFTILDTYGKRHAAQFTQVPTTAFDALYTPYSFMGLGRTNNYIENLHVGSTFKNGDENRNSTAHTINFEGIIPNAQVVITPSTQQHSWHIEMYLKKNKWVPFVAIVVSTLCLILGGVVFALHIHEKKEDEIERKKESHHINFQAL